MEKEVKFHVWLTVITDGFTEQIVGKLVRRNWKVMALGNTLSLRSEDNLATVLAFSMTKKAKSDEPDDEITQSIALEEVRDVVKRLNVKYYSLIVTQSGGCTWVLGNITKSSIEKENEEQKKCVN
jgi:hypothetical protein